MRKSWNMLSNIELIRIGSIFFLVVIGTIYDLFNARKIPLHLFLIPGLIGLYFFTTEFNYIYLTLVIFSVIIITLFQTFNLWNWADSLTFFIIGLHYPLLLYPILLIGSIFTGSFWGIYMIQKGMTLSQIFRMSIPFLPSFLVGFIFIIALVGFWMKFNFNPIIRSLPMLLIMLMIFFMSGFVKMMLREQSVEDFFLYVFTILILVVGLLILNKWASKKTYKI